MQILFLIIEYAGIIAFSISGAMIAIDKEADLIGVIIMSVITSFGGGILRDLLIGSTPPKFFTEYIVPIIVCVCVSLLVFVSAAVLGRKYVENERRIDAINNVFDALGLGIFAVYGTLIALDMGYTSAFIAISMGLISSVCGGLMRDLILRDIPFIIRKRIYALAAVSGAALFYILYTLLDVNVIWATFAGVMLTFVLRMCATAFKWNMPKAIVFLKLSRGSEENSGEK